MCKENDEMFEVDFHEEEKNKRLKRIKGKKNKKKHENIFDDDKLRRKPKVSYNRHHEKEILRDIVRDYQ